MASLAINRQSNWREKEDKTRQMTFTISPAKSLLLKTHAFTSPNRHPQRRSTQTRHTPLKFDIISYLPPEIVVEIFMFLSPVDLCSVCAVCQSWNRLAQLDRLAKIRRMFIRQRRQLYSGNKENPHSVLPHTPQPLHSSTLTRSHTSSPLNSIQATPKRHVTPPRCCTPSPTPLEEEVEDLHLVDIRRCLFPTSGQDPRGADTVGKRNKYRLKRL